MTIHIGAKKSQIADTVLLPGDPLRAKWAANRFLSNVTEVNTVRGMLGYTGTWKKKQGNNTRLRNGNALSLDLCK